MNLEDAPIRELLFKDHRQSAFPRRGYVMLRLALKRPAIPAIISLERRPLLADRAESFVFQNGQ